MKFMSFSLVCMLLYVPILGLAQNQAMPQKEPAAATPATAQMPGMMVPGGAAPGVRGGAGGMQVKAMAQQMMTYLKLCDEIKNNPAHMEKIDTAAADLQSTQEPTLSARSSSMGDTATVLADALTMMKDCKGLKDDKAKMANLDSMISQARDIAEGKVPTSGNATEAAKAEIKGSALDASAKGPADANDPMAMRRQMVMKSLSLQKLVPETAEIMKTIEPISKDTEAMKGLDSIIATSERIQQRMKPVLQMRQPRMNMQAPASPAASTQ